MVFTIIIILLKILFYPSVVLQNIPKVLLILWVHNLRQYPKDVLNVIITLKSFFNFVKTVGKT